jgi:Fur family transcriptional regulator, stress-responsive regulator
MRSPTAIIERYRERGLRITPQRRKIIELLAQDDSHPTVDVLYQKLKDQMPEVARSTVYNTLHELVILGELHEVQDLSEGGTRYDTELHLHHHLYCQRCHKLVDIPFDEELLELPAEKSLGFRINRSQVTFYGICPECQS